jgi:hypothetical protein
MRSFTIAIPMLTLLLSCTSVTKEDEAVFPVLYPIHGDSRVANPPTAYKGLSLSLSDNGSPDIPVDDSKIGMVCIGMSNAAQECDRYLLALENVYAAQVRPNITVVNCALASHAIERWNDPNYDSALWTRCLDRIVAAGMQLSDVRVVLHKAANQYTTGPDGQPLPAYPNPNSDFFKFKENLGIFANRVTAFFPELDAVFTTSRSYGGFSSRPDRGEPISYEEGHALNQWLSENPRVDGVWFGWGPYIWAPACETGIRNGRGFCYDRSDYSQDAIHPSSTGEVKITQMWHSRLSEFAWYRR